MVSGVSRRGEKTPHIDKIEDNQMPHIVFRGFCASVSGGKIRDSQKSDLSEIKKNLEVSHDDK